MRCVLAAMEPPWRYPMRGTFVACCAHVGVQSAEITAQRAKGRICFFISSSRLSPYGCFLVAVGTALASGPPHGSVREGLPHTALTSGSCDGQPLVGIRMLSLLAACRTHHKPCDSHPRLCVRHECACGAFPLVDLLPSADSAANA